MLDRGHDSHQDLFARVEKEKAKRDRRQHRVKMIAWSSSVLTACMLAIGVGGVLWVKHEQNKILKAKLEKAEAAERAQRALVKARNRVVQEALKAACYHLDPQIAKIRTNLTLLGARTGEMTPEEKRMVIEATAAANKAYGVLEKLKNVNEYKQPKSPGESRSD